MHAQAQACTSAAVIGGLTLHALCFAASAPSAPVCVPASTALFDSVPDCIVHEQSCLQRRKSVTAR